MASAALLLALAWAAPGMPAGSGLHPSLQAVEPWLGTWQDDTASGVRARIEYRAVLGGRFVETWRRDAGNGELIGHAMIAAGEAGGALLEYRFDAQGRMSVGSFDPGELAAVRRADTVPAEPHGTELAATLSELAPFLGQWEVATEWFGGGFLWAQMTNRAEFGGRVVVSRILAAEDGNGAYDRYRNFYYRDRDGTLREIIFSYRGKVVSENFAVEANVSGTTLTSEFSRGSMASTAVRKVLRIESGHEMHWADWFEDDASRGWRQAVDATWVRTASADPSRGTMPIDDTLFAAAGDETRAVTVERVMAAPPEKVWGAWTTESGWRAAYAPGRPEVRANIVLAPGGRYEWLFDGELGCNGCQVLSYIPNRMLSFSWNSPVTQPRTRLGRTWMVIEIEPVGDRQSRVRATQLGFGTGPQWDETRAYFEKAWTYVLDQMANSFAEG